MRQRLTFVLLRAALAVLTAGLLGVLLAPAAADAAFFTYDAPSLSYDVEVNDAQLAVDNQHTSNGDGVAADSGVTPASAPIGHVYDSSAIFVAPSSALGRVDDVIAETNSATTRNITSRITLSADEAL